jgi:acetyltransferase-like isoleucine patch superfamily enzyme
MNKLLWAISKRLFGNVDIGAGSRVDFLRARGARHGHLRVGASSMIDAKLGFDRSEAEIVIGDRTFVGRSALVAAQRISIGNDVLISWDVTIVDHDSHAIDFAGRRHDVEGWLAGRKDWSHVEISPVSIADKVWIGFGAAVLKGVTIGEGAVIAARSLVVKDVAPWTLVAGNPARPIRDLKPHD